jgi:GDPmannose 4,6-dehydratase
MKTALITGIAGQDGSYLAELLLEKGYKVFGLLRSADSLSSDNLRGIRERIEIVHGNLLDGNDVRRLVAECRPSEIYNLAARASSRTLISDPVLTAEMNGLAVARLLEAVRLVDADIRVCQASSSEVYGRSTESPQNELTPFRPRNPYGVAKLFAQGMVASYREHYGIFACSSILFNHESPRRGREFVTRKISLAAAGIKAGLSDALELGDLEARRDWGYAPDYVRGMWLMLQAAAPDDYVLATGESHSVREFCEVAFGRLGLDYRRYVVSKAEAARLPDSVPLVGDARKAARVLSWRPTVGFADIVRGMVDADWESLSRGASQRSGP